MRYQKFDPSPELGAWVECYYEWTGHAKNEIDVQSPPNARAAMVFNLAAPCSSYQYASPRQQVPMAFVCGQFTSNYHIVLQGPVHMRGIVFRPCGVHDFLGLRMSMLVNTRMDLKLVLNDQVEILRQNLLSEPGTTNAAFEKFLHDRRPSAQERLNVINDVVAFVDQNRGDVTVHQMADRFGTSKRYLEKRFLEKVGISPKLYARMIRFSYISTLIAHKEKVDWQEVIEQHGLHDQSHLVKEFIEFNKLNPSEYHQNHNELIRLLSKD